MTTPAAASYSVSPGFPAFLARLKLSLAVSSYQSGRLMLLGHAGEKLTLHERQFQRAMGIYSRNDTLYLASLFQIHRFENILTPGQTINGIYDSCFVPRASYTTGALDIHDVGLDKDGLIFVNTKFNCLARLSERNSFSLVWKPRFIDTIIGEDRCHLNGMAIDKGAVRYVTAVAQTNGKDEWREHRNGGGIVIDVAANEIICRGLSMPHSPRMHNGKLWVLNAGTGELGIVENDAFTPAAFMPGFGRGLAFAGKYAFVGLSKPRYHRFEGLPIGERLEESKQEAFCGVQVIDIESGACVEWFKADGGVAEIFDVALLNGKKSPMSLGFQSDEILTVVSHD